MPEDEKSWKDMFVIFATASGNIRRNRLSDFESIKANGKIAMKLNDGDSLISVQVASEDDDVLLAASGGNSIRCPVSDVRVFSGRTSTGVRGIKLKAKDEVISMSIVRHVDFKTEERDMYLKLQSARRRVARGEGDGDLVTDPAAAGLDQGRFDEMEAMEEFILTITVNGYGKRTSAYEYRIAGRGGQGITNIETSKRNGNVIASFPVASSDQLVMVTDGGQLIRTTVVDIRIAGRTTQGVTLFKTSKGESVVSVSRLTEEDEEEQEDQGNDNPDTSSEKAKQE